MKGLIRIARLPLLASLVLICVSCGSGSSSQPTSSSNGSSGTTFVRYTSPTAEKIAVSAVFHGGPVDSVRALEEPWAKGFRTYIAQSGNEAAVISVTCDPVDPQNAEAQVKNKIDGWTKQGHQVVPTNYKYAN